MILESTTKKIVFSAAEAKTTNPLDFSAHFIDVAAAIEKPQSSSGSDSGNPGPTTIVAAPGSLVIREIEEIIIANNDTVSHVVSVSMNDGGTLRLMVKATLAAGNTLYYNNYEGWLKLAL